MIGGMQGYCYGGNDKLYDRVTQLQEQLNECNERNARQAELIRTLQELNLEYIKEKNGRAKNSI